VRQSAATPAKAEKLHVKQQKEVTMTHDTAIKNILPKAFWQTVEKRLTDIVRHIPDHYSVLADGERERIDDQCGAFIDQLRADFVANMNTIAGHYLSEGRPTCVSDTAAITIKDGKVKVALEMAQSGAPQQLYMHRGQFLVVLIEDQLDWVDRLERMDMAERTGAEADDMFGATTSRGDDAAEAA